MREHHEGELKRTRLATGDILVTIKGRIGNAAVVENAPAEVNINQDVALLRLRPEYHPYYVSGFINSIAGKALVEQACTAQINPFLSLTNLKMIPIPIFPAQQMNSWGDMIKDVVDEARDVETQAHNLLERAKQRVEGLILDKGI